MLIGAKLRNTIHNLERRLQALDPYSYLNPRKRALEGARGFSQLFGVDCSSSSSDNKNEEEKSLTLRRKRQFPGLNNGDPRRQHGWFAEDQGQSVPYDDFRSSVTRGESVRPSAIDSRHRENASEPARRMPEPDSQRRGRPPGASPRAPLPMGEIVEVEGGHIVRSTGRKDRHSKVYTAKGPRDRRVRLSASTAIQFYDLQDRLGYDRPSKAVAWLIEKAKASIDELDRLPDVRPPVHPAGNVKPVDRHQDHEEDTEAQAVAAPAGIRGEYSRAVARERARERAKERTQERDAVAKAAVDNSIQASYLNFNLYANASNISATHSLIQALQLQNPAQPKGFTQSSFQPMDANMTPSDSMSRSLQLQLQEQQTFYHSLPSHTTQPLFETPSVVFCEAERSRNHQAQPGLFTGSAYQVPAAPFARDVAVSENHSELRAYPWANNGSLNGRPADFGHFGSNVGLGNHNSFAIRGTLQSSSSPVRVRPMPVAPDLAAAATDHFFSASASVPLGGGGGFSGFRIPARIQGIDEHDDVKPLAASSSSQM